MVAERRPIVKLRFFLTAPIDEHSIFVDNACMINIIGVLQKGSWGC
jgi:hypothetical protein